jgi:hypothetical protein
MRLATAGKPSNFQKQIIGIVSRDPLPKESRTDRIFISDGVSASAVDLDGYSGVLTTSKSDRFVGLVPFISSVRDIEHLRTNDIVAIEPTNGFIRTLYRPDSQDNVIFTTERCNSNCFDVLSTPSRS